jgi:DNA mismatch endonuclease (patch repair protein)
MACKSTWTKYANLPGHVLRYGFRLHQRDLPGKPDLVLTRHRKIILVHGCFWHVHQCRYGRVQPRTRPAFWRNKREGNRERDQRQRRLLRQLGWKVLIVWECELKKLPDLEKKLSLWLNDTI